MRIHLARTIMTLAVASSLGTGSVWAFPPAETAYTSERDYGAIPSERASILLAEIRSELAGFLSDIQKETVELSPQPYPYGYFPFDTQDRWQKRAPFMDRAKSRMSVVGERITALQHIRQFVLPWQKQAILEVTTHAAQVASSIRAAMIHLRENQNRLFVSQYRDHLATISNHLGEMKHVVDKFLDHERAPKVAQLLNDSLEPASGSAPNA